MKKVLLAEDNEDTLGLLSAHLTRCNCEVTCAKDGSDALAEVARSIKSKPFDLMILDIAMMWVDGFTLAKAIRCYEQEGLYERPVRILFHTAHAEAFNNQDLLKRTHVPIDDCFIKAADTGRLLERLDELTSDG